MTAKRIGLISMLFCFISTAFAGGILTNTNQSARFARLMALEASTKADAAYYNPAGTIKLPEGFHFTFSNQSAFQERIINSTFEGYRAAYGGDGGNFKQFKGTASAPIIPSLQGVYRKGKWALSGSVAVVGGGGKATFDDGLSMFEAPISSLVPMLNGYAPALIGGVPGASLKAKGYSVNQYMTGSNFIYGAQLGGAYKINDMFSVYGGFRLNIVHNKYEGQLTNLQLHIESQGLGVAGLPDNDSYINPAPILDMVKNSNNPLITPELKAQLVLPGKAAGEGAYLESKQSGWGVAPIIGFHFSHKGLNIGAKYEFRTSLDVENKTTRDDTNQFKDGVNTAHDVPALLAIGASYDIIEPLTVSVGYHHFFDKNAGMANDKQKALEGGTNEYLAGIEYRIDRMFLVSMGGQITRYGLADGFQSDLSFYVNSYSLGFGGAVNVSKNVQINVGYFFTDYSDYKMAEVAGQPSNVYTRKNKVFTAGIDFSF